MPLVTGRLGDVLPLELLVIRLNSLELCPFLTVWGHYYLELSFHEQITVSEGSPSGCYDQLATTLACKSNMVPAPSKLHGRYTYDTTVGIHTFHSCQVHGQTRLVHDDSDGYSMIYSLSTHSKHTILFSRVVIIHSR
jgi:hypothetical protein